MRNRGQYILGGVLIFMGVLFLLGTLFDVNAWALCWPTILVLAGLWLLLRPRLAGGNQAVDVVLIGDLDRGGAWTVRDQEFYVGIGDVDLDLTRADIPLGETSIRIYGLIGDVEILIPQGVGITATSTAFVTDARFNDRKQDGFLTPVTFTSPDYDAAERKIRVEVLSFINELKLRIV
jgi:lia operon protein LiaF